MEINPQDIRVEILYGGSSWSRTSNIIEVTHLPTGIKTRSSKERSQHANKHIAMQEMISILTNETDFTKQMRFAF